MKLLSEVLAMVARPRHFMVVSENSRLWVSVNKNQDWRGAIVSFQAAVIVESLVC
jgi:hypothetical protein